MVLQVSEETKEECTLLISRKGEQASIDMEKTEVLNKFDWGRGQESKIPPTASKEQVQDHVIILHVHKSTGQNIMHLRVLQKMADIVAMPLSIIFEKSWPSGKVHSSWKKETFL